MLSAQDGETRRRDADREGRGPLPRSRRRGRTPAGGGSHPGARGTLPGKRATAQPRRRLLLLLRTHPRALAGRRLSPGPALARAAPSCPQAAVCILRPATATLPHATRPRPAPHGAPTVPPRCPRHAGFPEASPSPAEHSRPSRLRGAGSHPPRSPSVTCLGMRTRQGRHIPPAAAPDEETGSNTRRSPSGPHRAGSLRQEVLCRP